MCVDMAGCTEGVIYTYFLCRPSPTRQHGALLSRGFSRADYDLYGARGNSFEALPDVLLPP